MINDEQAPTLEAIEKAFDIETVTKEFFIKYRELFMRTKEELDRIVKKDPKIKADFETKCVDTVNFAKKLLGQIVFLYFLQKKGWFGVGRDDDWGTGSKQFLRELFEKKHADYENFFNDILEPLFYEALRTGQEREHEDYYYSQFDCKIPFLNGGLFDPIGNYDWVHTDIFIPDNLFSNNVKTKEGDTGDGILDVFDRYNFTVKEDEPLEKEVAIDPELLGKAYEKFNAIRPDNYEEYKKALMSGKKGEEGKFNKQYGVYYTPREIVHYMCQQSLINYLFAELNSGEISYEKFSDSNLDMFGNVGKKGQLNLTIKHKETPDISKEDIETLIHYGEQVSENEARIVSKGKETSTYFYKLPESIRKNAKLLDQKLADITVCDPAVGSGAFPVGMMSEIVKTRNVLSVFLKDSEKTIYDFKRRCIEHSLYGVDIDPGAVEIAKLRLWLSLVVDEEDIKNIKPLPNLYYKIVCGNSLLGVEKDLFNLELFSELERLKPLFFKETNPRKKQDYKTQIDDLISQITNGHNEFDFEVYFSEVFHKKGGFDVVIANPPYIGESGHKELFRKTKNGPLQEFYIGKMDYFYFFLHLALNLAREKKGEIAFITTNYYLTATGARKLRADLKNRALILRLINFNELRIFESAQGQHNIISLLKKGKGQEYAHTCITNRTGHATSEVLSKILRWNDDESQYYEVSQQKLYDGTENYIRLICVQGPANSYNITINSILDKVASQGEKLGKITNINQGVVSGCDYVSGRNIDKLENRDGIEKNDGIFVFDLKNLRDVDTIKNFSSKEKKLLRPFFKNSDISRYWCEKKPSKLLLYYEDHLNENEFPNVATHLKKFYGILKSRLQTYGENYHWTALHRAREEKIFLGNKIVVPYRSTKNSFAINNREWFCRSDCYVITEKADECDLRYILALLNSTLYFQWMYNRGKKKGETLELFQVPLSEIPIKKISPEEQKPFIDLVDQILELKKSNPYTNTSKLEAEIDQLVYKLYVLTEDEIVIVEDSLQN